VSLAATSDNAGRPAERRQEGSGTGRGRQLSRWVGGSGIQASCRWGNPLGVKPLRLTATQETADFRPPGARRRARFFFFSLGGVCLLGGGARGGDAGPPISRAVMGTVAKPTERTTGHVDDRRRSRRQRRIAFFSTDQPGNRRLRAGTCMGWVTEFGFDARSGPQGKPDQTKSSCFSVRSPGSPVSRHCPADAGGRRRLPGRYAPFVPRSRRRTGGVGRLSVRRRPVPRTHP